MNAPTAAAPVEMRRTAPGVLRSASVLGGGTVLAAVLGLGFQSLLAYWFGAGAETDAWFMSLSIYAFLAKFLMLTNLKSLTLPAYARLRREDPARADALAGGLFRLSVVVLSLLSALVVVAAPLLVDLLAPGYEGHIRDLTVTLVRIRVPGLLMLGAVTVGMAVLESRSRFGVTISAQKVVPAAVSLALLLVVADRLGIVGVGWIGLVATVAGALVVVVAARGSLAPTPLRAAARDPVAREVGRHWINLGWSNGATFVGEWAFRVGASLLPVGMFSAVLYGRMVHDLLHGAVNDAAQTASLPRLAREATVGEGEAPEEGQRRLGVALREGMDGLAGLNLPVALFVALTAPWTVALLFGRGRFLQDGMLRPAATALAIFSVGFLLQGLVQLVFAAAFASNRSALVNRVQVVGHLARAAALVPLVKAFSYVGLVAAQVGMNALVLALLLAWSPRAWGLRRSPVPLRAAAAALPATVLHLLVVAPRLPDPLALGTMGRLAVLAGLGLGWTALTFPLAVALDVPGLRPLLARLRPGRGAAAAGVLVAAVAVGIPGGRAAALEPALRRAAPAVDTLPASPEAPLPDDHWLLPVLEWMEARGALPAGTSAFRPLTVRRAVELLEGAAGGGEGAAARRDAAAAASAALARLGAETVGHGWLVPTLGVDDAGAGARPAARLDAAVGGDRVFAWGTLQRRGDAVARGGMGLRLGPLDVDVARERLTLGGGATGAVVLNPSAPVDGLLLHTRRPFGLPALGATRLAFGVGPVSGYRAVDSPWLGFLRLTARPAPWIQVGVSRAALVGGHFGGGTVPYDAKVYGPDEGSVSAGDVLRILAGGGTDYDDQVAALDVRASFASLGLPALAYAEMGWEDWSRSWGDPALLAGLLVAPRAPFPLTLRYEYAAFGAPARLCGGCDTLPAYWYRHVRFQDGWVVDGALLGHPLGGYGLQHRVAVSAWSAGFDVRVTVHADRLRRDRWNLLYDQRPGWAWAGGAEAAWRLAPSLEARGSWSREGELPARWSAGVRWLPGAAGAGMGSDSAGAGAVDAVGETFVGK